jgi:CHAT domain-containing protein
MLVGRQNATSLLTGLVLSLVDQNGRPRAGFLSLQDIYNMKLPADLVVLGGCETALGEEINGEGLVALTRGFMSAGAPRVVASLWKSATWLPHC